MKFTEGYWLPSEKANASHAMQAYEVEQIPGGMRILATTRPIEHRGMTLNLPTITVEFVAHTYWYAYREKESSLTPLRQTEKS